jgi:Serpin (serine protease inhibitor)
MFTAKNPDLVSAYAARINPSLLGLHAVTSPLGLWLLLALVAPATEGAARLDLEAALGTRVDDAAARARALLNDPHPAVSALTAVWDRNLGPAFDEWAQTLPGIVERGPVPDQARANAWAQEHTNGAINEFPIHIDELTRLLLASAVATDIAWARPLDTTEDLGGQFGAAIHRALTLDDGIQLIADTDAAGPVAVAAPRTSSALDVLSVIAAPDITPANVDRAAHQVAAMLRGDDRTARQIPAEELADGHAWTVAERREQRIGGPDVQTEWRSHLPAWSASSDHDLKNAPGIRAVFDTLTGFSREEDQPVEFSAKQAAVASYTRAGFKAAAVTAIGMRAGSMPAFHEVLVRSIELGFNRPYAVLACAATDQGPPAWRGVPVFSAWITQPDETVIEAPGRPQPVDR